MLVLVVSTPERLALQGQLVVTRVCNPSSELEEAWSMPPRQCHCEPQHNLPKGIEYGKDGSALGRIDQPVSLVVRAKMVQH